MTPFTAVFQYRCYFVSPEMAIYGIGGGGGGGSTVLYNIIFKLIYFTIFFVFDLDSK